MVVLAGVEVEAELTRAVQPFKKGAPGRDLIKLENAGKRTALPHREVYAAVGLSQNQAGVSAAPSLGKAFHCLCSHTASELALLVCMASPCLIFRFLCSDPTT